MLKWPSWSSNRRMNLMSSVRKIWRGMGGCNWWCVENACASNALQCKSLNLSIIWFAILQCFASIRVSGLKKGQFLLLVKFAVGRGEGRGGGACMIEGRCEFWNREDRECWKWAVSLPLSKTRRLSGS
jgi:hypothetical protein